MKRDFKHKENGKTKTHFDAQLRIPAICSGMDFGLK
jgi:hypothetical protein